MKPGETQAVIERLREHASQHRYTLSASAGKLVEAMFKRRAKHGGMLLCPCRVVDPAASPGEMAKIACPCIHAAAEIEADGQCLCGMFLKGTPAGGK
jgi:ferredoxin-thioredoxin reductase catalytic subunit